MASSPSNYPSQVVPMHAANPTERSFITGMIDRGADISWLSQAQIYPRPSIHATSRSSNEVALSLERLARVPVFSRGGDTVSTSNGLTGVCAEQPLY